MAREELKMDSAKISAIKKFPIPSNLKEVQRFNGLIGYYRKFIRDYAQIAYPLYQLMKKLVTFEWTQECQQAFEKLISIVCEEVVLDFPDFKAASEDPSRPLT